MHKLGEQNSGVSNRARVFAVGPTPSMIVLRQAKATGRTKAILVQGVRRGHLQITKPAAKLIDYATLHILLCILFN